MKELLIFASKQNIEISFRPYDRGIEIVGETRIDPNRKKAATRIISFTSIEKAGIDVLEDCVHRILQEILT